MGVCRDHTYHTHCLSGLYRHIISMVSQLELSKKRRRRKKLQKTLSLLEKNGGDLVRGNSKRDTPAVGGKSQLAYLK